MAIKRLLTIFIIGDGYSDNIVSSHHGAAPVVTERCTEMHLKLLLRLEHGVVSDVNCAVFHLENAQSKHADEQSLRTRTRTSGRILTQHFTFSPFRKVMRDSSAFLLSSKSSITMADMVRVKQRTDDLKERSPVRMMGMWRRFSFSFTV